VEDRTFENEKFTSQKIGGVIFIHRWRFVLNLVAGSIVNTKINDVDGKKAKKSHHCEVIILSFPDPHLQSSYSKDQRFVVPLPKSKTRQSKSDP